MEKAPRRSFLCSSRSLQRLCSSLCSSERCGLYTLAKLSSPARREGSRLLEEAVQKTLGAGKPLLPFYNTLLTQLPQSHLHARASRIILLFMQAHLHAKASRIILLDSCSHSCMPSRQDRIKLLILVADHRHIESHDAVRGHAQLNAGTYRNCVQRQGLP